MTRLRASKRIASLILLLVTIPVLALLCRGRTPNRFAEYNLPPWELHLIGRPSLPTDLACRPISPANIRFIGSSSFAGLLRQNEDRLFANLDTSPGAVDDPAAAGDPGRWLQRAIVFTGSDPRMRAKIERVCARLMDAQNPRGYLGAPNGSMRYPSTDLIAHCENMRGLLAAYSVLHEPALILASLRAGSFLIENFDPSLPGDAPARGEVIYGLSRLYEATGDARLVDFASKATADTGVRVPKSEGAALCALFEVTGRKDLLLRAIKYSRTDKSAELAVEIFKITGNRDYLVSPGKGKADDPLLDSVALTYRGSQLSLNEWRHCLVAIGSERLLLIPAEHAGSVQVLSASTTPLRLRIPSPDNRAALTAEASGKPILKPIGPSGQSTWSVSGKWQRGTVLMVAETPARFSGDR